MAVQRNKKKPTKKPLLLRRKTDPKGVENKTPLLLRRKKLTGNNNTTSKSAKKESTSKAPKFGEMYMKNLRAKQARLNSKPKAKVTTPSKRKTVKSVIKPKVSGIVKNAGASKPKGTILKKAPVKKTYDS